MTPPEELVPAVRIGLTLPSRPQRSMAEMAQIHAGRRQEREHDEQDVERETGNQGGQQQAVSHRLVRLVKREQNPHESPPTRTTWFAATK
jgi:hypothetical protein